MDDSIYTLEIGGRPVLCFPAAGHREARSLLKEEWLLGDLRELKCDGNPLWDGRSKLTVRGADSVEASRFERESKYLPEDDDLPVVYLVKLY